MENDNKKRHIYHMILVHLKNWTYRFNTTIYFSRENLQF